MDINDAIGLTVTELLSATAKFGEFASAHEGWAIIFEELDELWDEVKKKHEDPTRLNGMRTEAKHVAAMGIRFLMDICEMEYEELSGMAPD